MAKKTEKKYVLYGMSPKRLAPKILNSGKMRISNSKELISILSNNYGIKELGGLAYDGRCGLYTIYKTRTDKDGRYYVLHIERK